MKPTVTALHVSAVNMFIVDSSHIAQLIHHLVDQSTPKQGFLVKAVIFQAQFPLLKME